MNELDFQSNARTTSEDDQFTGISSVNMQTGTELSRFKSYIVQGLDVNKDYLFRVRYTFNKDRIQKVVYKDLVGKQSLKTEFKCN